MGKKGCESKTYPGDAFSVRYRGVEAQLVCDAVLRANGKEVRVSAVWDERQENSLMTSGVLRALCVKESGGEAGGQDGCTIRDVSVELPGGVTVDGLTVSDKAGHLVVEGNGESGDGVLPVIIIGKDVTKKGTFTRIRSGGGILFSFEAGGKSFSWLYGGGGAPFQKLTPTDEADGDVMESGYTEALDFFFDDRNRDLCNVAITGPYSSGKSSVLETYVRDHPGRKLYRVSLASFPDSEGKPCSARGSGGGRGNGSAGGGSRASDGRLRGDESRDGAVNTVEGKMLNQLIQQIPCRKIPYTDFRVKRDRSLAWRILAALSVAVAVLGIVFLACGNAWGAWVADWEKWAGKYGHGAMGSWFDFTTRPWFKAVVLAVVIVICAVWLFYLISVLVNRSVFRRISIRGSEFDMLSGEDDSYFDKYADEIVYLFSRLGGVTVVIEDLDRFDDVRIFSRLREINSLINARGKRRRKRPVRFLYLMRDDVFAAKERTKFFDLVIPVMPVVDASNSYDALRGFLEGACLLDGIDDGLLKGICVYMDDMRVVKNVFNEFMVFDEALKGSSGKMAGFDRGKLLAMTVYKNVFPRDYARLQLRDGYVYVMLKGDGRDIPAKRDLRGMRRSDVDERSEDVSKYLRKREKGTDLDGRMDESPNFGLLRYLLTEGVIDCTYSLYMARAGVLCEGDAEFVRAVQSGLENEEDLPIADADAVMGYMTDGMLARPGARNFDIVDHLVSTGDTDSLRIVANQSEGEDGEAFMSFFVSYYLYAEGRGTVGEVVSAFNRACPGFFSSLYGYSADAVGEETARTAPVAYGYSLHTLVGVRAMTESANAEDVKVVEKVRADGRLSSYVSARRGYIGRDDVERCLGADVGDGKREDVVSGMKTFGVRLKRIDAHSADPVVLEGVYSEGLYERTRHNFDELFGLKFSGHTGNTDGFSILTVMKGSDTGLYECYLKDNPDVMLEHVLGLLKEGEGFLDSQDVVADILNSPNLSGNVRSEYLRRSETVIEDLSWITKEGCYEHILSDVTVAYSGDNAMRYYEACGFTDDLVRYLNSSKDRLTFGKTRVPLGYGFFRDSMRSEGLDDGKFSEIVSGLGIEVAVLDPGLPEGKVRILWQSGKIARNERNTETLRDCYPGVET